VYGLGVTLYELLTLRPAFDAPDRGRLVKQITHDEPMRPRKLDRRVPSDLETIVLKAIEKEPRRRYLEAGDMVEDLRRFLGGEPIRARRAGVVERTWKWMKRRPAAASLLILLVMFALAMTERSMRISKAYRQAIEAQSLADTRLERALNAEMATRGEAEKARLEAAKLAEIGEFLENMLASADPFTGLGRETTVREVLDRASAQLEHSLGGQSDVRASLYDTIGWTYYSLGLMEPAEKHLRSAIAIRRQILGNSSIDLANSLQHLAIVIFNTDSGTPVRDGLLEEGREMAREAAEIRGQILGPNDPQAAFCQGLVSAFEFRVGNRDDGELARVQVLVVFASVFQMTAADLEQRMQEIRRLWADKHHDEALRAVRQSAQELNAKLKMPPVIAHSLQAVVHHSIWRDDLDLAEPLCLVTAELWREIRSDEHPDFAASCHNLGMILRKRKKYDEAVEKLSEALRLRRQALGDEHPQTINSLRLLATTYDVQQNYAAALPLFLELLEHRRVLLGEDHLEVLSIKKNIATALAKQRRYREAEPLDREVLEKRRQALGPDHRYVLTDMRQFADTLVHLRKYSEAEAVYREAIAVQRTKLGDAHADVATNMHSLVRTLNLAKKYEDAEPIARQLLEIRQNQPTPDEGKLGDSHYDLAVTLLNERRSEADGIAQLRLAVDFSRRARGDQHAQTTERCRRLAWWLANNPKAELRQPTESVELARRCTETDAKKQIHWQALGMAQVRAGQFEDAIRSLHRSCELGSGGGVEEFLFLAMAYAGQADQTNAKQWFAKAETTLKQSKRASPHITRFHTEAAALLEP
jgi:serine/threonine-protein kinase